MGKNGSIYSVIRIVPNPDDGQFMNVGIILVSRDFPHIQIRIERDYSKLRWICKDFDSKVYDAIIDKIIDRFNSMSDQVNLRTIQGYTHMFDRFVKSDCKHIQFSKHICISAESIEKEMDIAYSIHIGGWDV